MVTPYKELFVNRGADFSNIIKITNPLTGNVVNISGNTVVSKFRSSYYTANASGEFVCTIKDAANGIIEMTLGVAGSDVYVHPGRYVYDVNMKDSSNNVVRILEGIVTLKPEASW